MEKRISDKGDKKILGVNFNKPLSLIVISVLLFIISSYSWGWAQEKTKGDARFGICSPLYSQNKNSTIFFLMLAQGRQLQVFPGKEFHKTQSF